MAPQPQALMWPTQDGRLIAIDQMETSHIRNSIARIRRSMRIGNDGEIVGWRRHWLPLLLTELERRNSKDNPDLLPARISNRFRNLDLD